MAVDKVFAGNDSGVISFPTCAIPKFQSWSGDVGVVTTTTVLVLQAQVNVGSVTKPRDFEDDVIGCFVDDWTVNLDVAIIILGGFSIFSATVIEDLSGT